MDDLVRMKFWLINTLQATNLKCCDSHYSIHKLYRWSAKSHGTACNLWSKMWSQKTAL